MVSIASGDVFIPVKIEETDLFTGCLKVLQVIRPNWPVESIKFKIFTDGITNKLVACHIEEDLSNKQNVVLVRVYGNKTDLLIDRHLELRNIKALNALGLAPDVYGVFENGLAYQYYPGSVLNTEMVLDPKIWPLIAKQMAKIHKLNLGPNVSREPMVYDKIEQFLRLLPEPFSDKTKQDRFVNMFGSVTKLRIEYERLQSHLTKSESPIVFAHNDLLLGNVVYNQTDGTISFIDYEYASYNYQAYDIANHFNEFVGISTDNIDYNKYPSKEFQRDWIRVYLAEFEGSQPSDERIETVLKQVEQLSLASHFLWGIWSLVQFELSDIDFDFGRYAEIRINRYYELRDKVFKDLC